MEMKQKKPHRGIVVAEDLEDLLFCLRKDDLGYKEIIEKTLEKVQVLNIAHQVV